MTLKLRQREYVRHRIAGLNQTGAAVAAGYSRGSAKALASRMEKLPAIKGALADARQNAPNGSGAAIEYASAEDYLLAVVRGLAVPDPVRCSAARAILPYQRARQRAPVRAQTPRQMQDREALTSEKEMLDQWAQTAARVRARLKRERTGT